MARKNIKVPEDLFLAMRDDKDDQQSWPHYLEEQCLHDGETDELPPGFVEIHDATEEQLAIVREKLENVPERTADEVEGRLR